MSERSFMSTAGGVTQRRSRPPGRPRIDEGGTLAVFRRTVLQPTVMTEQRAGKEQEFRPVGAVAFFAAMLVFFAAIWGFFYALMIHRH